MAVHLISKAWPIDMQTGMKFVLVALCDAANDDGACFLCVETVAYKCGMGLRTVQGHLIELEKQGFISRVDRMGRSSIFMVHEITIDEAAKHPAWERRQQMRSTPAKSAGVLKTPAETAGVMLKKSSETPAESAHPPAESAEAPAESAPITITYPSLNRDKHKSTAKAESFDATQYLLSQGVDPEVIQDWMLVRKAKKAKNTRTAFDGLVREAMKARITVDAAVRICCERNWVGFKAEWVAQRQDKVDPKISTLNQIWRNGNGNDRPVIELNPRGADASDRARIPEALIGIR